METTLTRMEFFGCLCFQVNKDAVASWKHSKKGNAVNRIYLPITLISNLSLEFLKRPMQLVFAQLSEHYLSHTDTDL